MRVLRLFTICLFMSPMTFLYAQSSLTVEIVNFESNKGVVIVDLMDKNEESVRDTTCEILDHRCTIIFKDLKSMLSGFTVLLSSPVKAIRT